MSRDEMEEKGALDDSGKSILLHLAELRRRFSIAVVAYMIGVMVLINFSEPVFDFISEPLRAALPEGTPLVFLNAPDVFFTYLKIALVLSLFATSPVTLYQFWAFVAPGLYRHEREAFSSYFFGSLGLLLAGGAFAFYIVFPLIFEFFLSFSTENIQAMPAVKEYLSLVLKLLFAFGVSFQIPIVIMLLVRLNIVDAESLADKRRYVIVWAFVFAAILTPPDIISQVLLGVPMLLLYEVGLYLAKMKKRKTEKEIENV
ncbi:sec-independent protein translocase protein TatC [Mariprofundus ferrinatatus]|uniref:Sec-independent protein translocase protein TatC n=1 Tax=Mariprofundus ferrinatatus TaxID=1921087 RepID=A0A2K8L907_9PROT|nr:twin-arginine translocase subunit TatC [Mariprofundus ferrinatatus]ATX82371.1 sec-independent protein translocase protein TatC [Mariprofundus ferrinatatus]